MRGIDPFRLTVVVDPAEEILNVVTAEGQGGPARNSPMWTASGSPRNQIFVGMTRARDLLWLGTVRP